MLVGPFRKKMSSHFVCLALSHDHLELCKTLISFDSRCSIKVPFKTEYTNKSGNEKKTSMMGLNRKTQVPKNLKISYNVQYSALDELGGSAKMEVIHQSPRSDCRR